MWKPTWKRIVVEGVWLYNKGKRTDSFLFLWRPGSSLSEDGCNVAVTSQRGDVREACVWRRRRSDTVYCFLGRRLSGTTAARPSDPQSVYYMFERFPINLLCHAISAYLSVQPLTTSSYFRVWVWSAFFLSGTVVRFRHILQTKTRITTFQVPHWLISFNDNNFCSWCSFVW